MGEVLGARRSSVVHAAELGVGAGLLACLAGAGYVIENAHIPGIAWTTVALVFVLQLVLTGAAVGALVSLANAYLDRRVGRRTSWAPPLATSLAMGLVAFPSGAFGAQYFGSLHAPFMGATAIFAIASLIAVALAVGLAWLDQRNASTARDASPFRRATLAGIGLALPVVAIGGAAAALTPDYEVLRAFRNASVPLLGGACGAALAIVYGVYAGLVIGVVRRTEKATPERQKDQPRTRVAAEAAAPLSSAPSCEGTPMETAIDPLAEEEAELEARFAELDRLERTRGIRAS